MSKQEGPVPPWALLKIATGFKDSISTFRGIHELRVQNKILMIIVLLLFFLQEELLQACLPEVDI